MKKEEINTRFVEAINSLLSSDKELSKTEIACTLGIKATKFSEILNFRMNIGTDLAATLCHEYGINPGWLLTGEGDMIKNETTNQLNQSSDSGILLKLLEEKEKKIEKLTEELRAMERKVGSLEAKLENVATLGNRTANNVSTAKPSSQSRAFAHSASAPLNE